MTDLVTVDIGEDVVRIRMDDGKVNAMSREMMRAINLALDEAEEADKVTVLQGREGIFSAGFDMKTFSKGADAGLEMVRMGAQLILRLLKFPLPVLTICTGHAYPMGAFLMLSADSRLGISGPWKIGMNEVAISITIPKFAIELARHRLTPPAFVQVSTAFMFSPNGAVLAGYLDHTVDPEALEPKILEECARLNTLDLPSFKATKQRANQPAINAIEAALSAEFGATTK